MTYPKVLFAATTVLVVFTSLAAHAGDVKVIANTSVSAASVSADELKNVFLETRNRLADGSHVQPVVAKGGPAHEAFLREYLGKNDSGLQAYYRSLVFTGKASMPKQAGSDAEMVAYVARTKGAIGYVSTQARTEGVKVLDVK